MATPQEKVQCVPCLFKQNQIHKLSGTTELSIGDIHHCIYQFVHGTKIYGDRNIAG